MGFVEAYFVGSLDHDSIIAGHGGQATTGRTVSIYGRDVDLARAVQLDPELLQGAPELPATVGLDLIHLEDVEAGREDVGDLGCQNDAVDVVRLLELVQLDVELGEEVEVEAVDGRAVQSQDGVALVLDVLHKEHVGRGAVAFAARRLRCWRIALLEQ